MKAGDCDCIVTRCPRCASEPRERTDPDQHSHPCDVCGVVYLCDESCHDDPDGPRLCLKCTLEAGL